ncbi:hypothetical protein [Lactobacillus phage JCL1032]|nr:hypothetical protein F367_gp72 [Lactobacillus phage JCL1032]ACB72612.1 hypothetical protein [Lactobacillus phage JCL1032]
MFLPIICGFGGRPLCPYFFFTTLFLITGRQGGPGLDTAPKTFS